jgi:3-hydroxybutyryl-CoA dehydratase
MTNIVRSLRFEDLNEGDHFSFEVTITAEDIDRFAALTGDVSPLHMDAKFARARGFKDRVVHGALQLGLVSKLIGVYLPGRNCLFQKCQIDFVAPVYPEQTLCVTGTVDQLSEATRSAVLKIRITSDDIDCARGKVFVGLTDAADG